MAPPEVTGLIKSGSRAKAKKKRKRKRPLTAAQLPMPAADAKMLTREEFCARNRISIPFYNRLKAQGTRSARDPATLQNFDHRRSRRQVARRARSRVANRRRVATETGSAMW